MWNSTRRTEKRPVHSIAWLTLKKVRFGSNVRLPSHVVELFFSTVQSTPSIIEPPLPKCYSNASPLLLQITSLLLKHFKQFRYRSNKIKPKSLTNIENAIYYVPFNTDVNNNDSISGIQLYTITCNRWISFEHDVKM